MSSPFYFLFCSVSSSDIFSIWFRDISCDSLAISSLRRGVFNITLIGGAFCLKVIFHYIEY